ncbi:Anti-sigma F factor antagonist (spoIIAA-2) [Imhoffiella purpurea]|uniref:Anti-sigma factor antagonist n=1 Tax=Imhoffiella purpurea TaxID=1249627 RepID=W9V5N6_9GAMM|nr:Anti-sigma F factor antagonist (spoIIAA-2) [Imhoffiella purpurea]
MLVMMPGSRLDTQTAPEADAQIAAAIAGGETRILIDFAQTRYISSAGLRVLLKASKQLGKVGAFGLCNANPQIREVLDISGFATIMHCYGGLDEGLEALTSP